MSASPTRTVVTLAKKGADFRVLPAKLRRGDTFTLTNGTRSSVVFRIDPAHHPFGDQPLLQEIAAGGSLERIVSWSKPGHVEFPYQVVVIAKALAGRKWAKGHSDPRIIIDR
jgi:hypothetical protein